MAFLLKQYHRSIPPAPNGKLIVRCPVDYRRIYSRVPQSFFGNAVRDAVAEFDPHTFDRLDLSEIAETIRKAIRSVDESSVSRSLVALEELRQEHGIRVFEELGCPGLLVSNLSRLPVHEIDFGTGQPLQLHRASHNPRLAAILPGPAGGYEIHVKLPV